MWPATQKYQDNLFKPNAMPPKTLADLATAVSGLAQLMEEAKDYATLLDHEEDNRIPDC